MSDSDIGNDGDKGYGEPPEPRRVKWLMRYNDGHEEIIFKSELALSALLITEKVFLNSHWREKDWPEEAKQSIGVHVICNDVFAWGCVDCESVSYGDLESLWDCHVKDPTHGTEVWCIVRRKEMPQRPVEKYLREGGIWDLDALREEHNLLPNYYDGISRVLAQRKYAIYCKWAQSLNREPRPYNVEWWAGWKEYAEANPGWYSDDWKTADNIAAKEWRSANGWGN
jgi:hypothetical protein